MPGIKPGMTATGGHRAQREITQGRDVLPEDQAELFDPDQAPVAYSPDPEHVRRRLNRILAEARAATVVPWEPERVRLYRTIFPQMTRWLPDEEAGQLRFAFDEEMARLKAA